MSQYYNLAAKENTMKHKNHFLWIAAAVIAIAALFAGCSEDNNQAERRGGSGRSWQETAYGTLQTFEGTISFNDPEWHLKTDAGELQLGLGNPSYLESTGLKLEEDMEVAVKGFLIDDEISVVSLIVGGEEVAFRTEDGVPLWAGRRTDLATAPSPPEEMDLPIEPKSYGTPNATEETDGNRPGGPGRNSEGGGRGRGAGSGRWGAKNNDANSESI